MADKAELRTCPFYDPDAEKFDDTYGCMGQFMPGKSDSPYCPRCRANMWARMNAEKKRPGSMRRYRNKLVCRHARLDEWTGIYTKTNKVVHISNGRKRRHA